eukprot:TRINITY_DN832_c0_g1_i1.p1 TRINITY_DN832_c0_g1~~TRINITY_DN832_c0_g1_i1.p1  ORF type:complete len:132 (+),score=17.74 TRINITY_DN832_c0_g1_i1:303-698(+)
MMIEQRLFFSHHTLDDFGSPFSTCLPSALIPPFSFATFASFLPPWLPRSPWRPVAGREMLISKLSSTSMLGRGARPPPPELGCEKRRTNSRPRKHASMARTMITESAIKTGPKEPLGCVGGLDCRFRLRVY